MCVHVCVHVCVLVCVCVRGSRYRSFQILLEGLIISNHDNVYTPQFRAGPELLVSAPTAFAIVFPAFGPKTSLGVRWHAQTRVVGMQICFFIAFSTQIPRTISALLLINPGLHKVSHQLHIIHKQT